MNNPAKARHPGSRGQRIVVLGEADDRRVLVGRRSPDVTNIRVLGTHSLGWSRVGACPPATAESTSWAPCSTSSSRRQESRGRNCDCAPRGLVHDVEQDGYDVCFVLEAPNAAPSQRPEYAETTVVPISGAQRLIEREGSVPTSRVLLGLAADAGLV